MSYTRAMEDAPRRAVEVIARTVCDEGRSSDAATKRRQGSALHGQTLVDGSL
jgi:hypothetical protein